MSGLCGDQSVCENGLMIPETLIHNLVITYLLSDIQVVTFFTR